YDLTQKNDGKNENPSCKTFPSSAIRNAVLLLRGRDGLVEGLQHIRDAIGSVLHTAAHPHHVVKHANSLPLGLGDTSVRHAAGHLDQTLDAAQALGEGEDASVLAEALGGGVAAAHAEGQHAAAHAVAVLLLGDVPVGVGVEARVVDSDD